MSVENPKTDSTTTSAGAATGGISRRTILKTAGLAGVAAAGIGLAGTRGVRYAIAGNAPKVRLAWTEVAACHSPLGFGLARGFYAKHNVDVELFYQGASGQTLIQALATNKADAGAGLLLDWLKPLEQGFDVKLFVGSHGGCQRLLASKASNVTKIEDVKGKTIATWDPGSPPKIAFSVTLAKAGIDPEQDVTWKVVPFDLVGEAVNRGDADIAAHMDPWAFLIERKFDFVKVADTQTGVYQNRVCCVLGANGPFLESNRDALRRVAEANLEIHEYTANHPDEVAAWYAENLKPGGLTAEELTQDLASMVFHDHPVGQALIDQVQASIEDLKLTKVIEPGTDAAALARSSTINILAS
ncbi:ABC transporter substrate-binding protein [Segnochrobactrum spirostomi]|uniref:ABC transporter substrate-binding protein n=1 Tax=Segnochrobactrum spirostomi TaxID=2608987 RepID=A0A6A7Y0V3_9HYPH|nr:ABC transporter substrate-binding protein [Segnochrobactrum spirostomi]MQT12017.1 ABC transporter substrate-binding protein [Segnochrobactrum spirostomi]